MGAAAEHAGWFFQQVSWVGSGWIMLRLKEWPNVSHATPPCALRSDSPSLLEELLVWHSACVQEVVEPRVRRIAWAVHFSILSLLGGTEPEEAGATQGEFQSIQPASACGNKRNYLSTGEQFMHCFSKASCLGVKFITIQEVTVHNNLFFI